jgi:hypothetical protein
MSSTAILEPRTLAGQPRPAISPVDRARIELAVSKWIALQDAVLAIALLAGIEAAAPSQEIMRFPENIERADGKRLNQAARAIDDLAMVVELGLSALLAARAQDTRIRPAALTLWREASAAQASILALYPPDPR